MLVLPHVRDFLLFIHNTISSDSFIKKYRILNTAFTRSRILTFPRLMLFILSLPRRTLSADLSSFLSFLDQGIPCTSKQAFSSARQNINPNAFLQLLRDSYQLASFRDTDGLWHGHCVKAIDGTTLRLPDTPENKEEFGTQKNQCKEYAMAKASCFYDVSHDMMEDVVLSNYRDSEKNHVFQLLDQGPSLHSPGKRPIILFDRGYPSQEMIAFLNSRNYLFLMRCSSSFLRCVNEAELGDTIVDYYYKKKKFHLRVIKFKLESGMVETLVTNIPPQDHAAEELIEFYTLRWSIEGKYRELKLRLKVENFSGKKPAAVKQDFYAALCISNLAAAIKRESDHLLREENREKNRKHEYQTNRNFLIGQLFEQHLLWIETCGGIERKLVWILERVQRERSPIRPNRKEERKFKMPKKVSQFLSNLRSARETFQFHKGKRVCFVRLIKVSHFSEKM